MKSYRFAALFVVIAMIVASCASNPTPAATTAATEAPAVTQAAAATTEAPIATTEVAATTAPAATTEAAAATTQAPAATPAMTATAAVITTTGGATAAVVATVPPDALQLKDKLQFCTDFPYPPQEFYDENGNPQGLDIEIGTEIANRLGLKAQYVNSVFDTIIAAVSSGKCDAILSAMNVTADRQKKVSMIPYFQAGQAFVAQKGNPQGINTALDLCGKSAAAESGTTEADYLQGTGDYKGKGLTQDCAKNSKKPINVVVTQKDTDALQQLQAGKVAVYFADSPVAAYYTVQHPDQFQLVGQVLQPAQEGIAVPCGQTDCTKAPLTPLAQAIQTALKSMMDDGTYLKILTKWNLADSAVTP
ncbi:MAG TPA: ABC transporter substrate-binding protein [Anaerolineales bacterium]